jgi:alpha-N-arabinofuranosidase
MNLLPKLICVGGSLLAPLAGAADSAALPCLQVDARQVTARVSPLHAGLMTEEINHCYDGGLYAELISNRAFRDEMSPASNLPPQWSVVQDGTAAAVLQVDEKDPLNSALNCSLRFDAIAATKVSRAGIANNGFWGIPVRPATAYHASFYAKIAGDCVGSLAVSIESPDGTTTYARTQVQGQLGDWHRYEADLTTATDLKPTHQARFVISTAEPGRYWFSLVSLFPPTFNHRANGNRVDLMQKLTAMKPAFLRFPGGNYLEGDTLATRFDWKKTLGPLTERPTHPGPWGYRSSEGLGLMEFLLWCEDLRVEPVLGVFAGNSLKGEFAQPGPALRPFVQDALDEIAYLLGDARTTWGARRAKDGHAAPFQLPYVEIGNEDWNPASDYNGRFAQFYDAIKAKYPQLQLIASTAVKSRVPDVLDDHYYRSAQQFFNDVHHYDRFERKGPKIFVGEWATVEGEPTPNLDAALGDAAWMTGMERNSDLVIMQAYAPLRPTSIRAPTSGGPT